MMRVTINEASRGLSKITNRISNRGERIILRRGEKDIAVIVPMEDLKLIEAMEDRLDVEAAREALAESNERVAYNPVRKKPVNVPNRTHPSRAARSGKLAKRRAQTRGRQNSVTR